VLGNGGTNITSTDGINWTPLSGITTEDWGPVVFGADRFVAVGNNPPPSPPPPPPPVGMVQMAPAMTQVAVSAYVFDQLKTLRAQLESLPGLIQSFDLH
jgi:hypothetical protein